MNIFKKAKKSMGRLVDRITGYDVYEEEYEYESQKPFQAITEPTYEADKFSYVNSKEDLEDMFDESTLQVVQEQYPSYRFTEPEPILIDPKDAAATKYGRFDRFLSKIKVWQAVLAMAVLVLVLIVFTVLSVNNARNTTVTTTAAETTSAATVVETTAAATETAATETTSVTTPTPTQSPVEVAVEEDLVEAGLPAEAIKTGSEVIFAEDSSTTGAGAININGTRTVEEMMAFLPTQGTNPEARMSYDFLVSKGLATDDLIYDPSNWAVIQLGVDFGLPGNTGSINQKFAELGYRDGNPGDILLVFYNPVEDIFVYFRGACANPQTLRPVPVVDITPTPTPKPTPTTTTPTPTPTPKPTTTTTPAPTPTPTLTPKDPAKEPASQSNAPEGSATNQDPGPGSYVEPTNMATSPAESRVEPTPPAPATATTATTTAATTTQAPVATPTPTRTPVVPDEPAASGTPVVPD